MIEHRSNNRHTHGGNKSLFKGLVILDRMKNAGGEVGIRELARSLSMPTTVVHRLVSTLKDFGYIEQDPGSRRYRIGSGAFFSHESREH